MTTGNDQSDGKAGAREVAQLALNALAEEFLGSDMPNMPTVLNDPDVLLRLEEIANGNE